MLVPNPPSFVVPLGINGKSTREHFYQTVEGDTAGAWLAIYSIQALDLVLERISTNNQLAFAFNRRPGGSDLQFIVDLSIGQKGTDTGAKTKTDFANCVGELINELGNKLKKQSAYRLNAIS